MTTQPLTDEQQIASLECQVVTMREALEGLDEYLSHEVVFTIIEKAVKKMVRSALSSSDYAGKVVVDRELLGEACDVLEASAGLLQDTHTRHMKALSSISDCGCPVATTAHNARSIFARLDSLRKGGK